MKRKRKKSVNNAPRLNEDTKQRRKFKKGGRIEAYTFGEALGKKKDPIWR